MKTEKALIFFAFPIAIGIFIKKKVTPAWLRHKGSTREESFRTLDLLLKTFHYFSIPIMNPLEELIHLLHENNLWDGEKIVKRNDFLCTKGKVDSNLYFVEEGALRIYLIEELEEITIRFGYRNNLIAALDSFLSSRPSDLYIQALKKSKLLSISKQRFNEFVSTDTRSAQLYNQLLEGFVAQQMERERDILTTSPKDRFERVLKRSPQLFQEIPNKYIASYLRMAPETLSRLKKS